MRRTACVTSLTVAEGAVLWRAGEVGHDVAITGDGNVGVSRPDGGAVAVVGPGEVVGEPVLFGERRGVATVSSMSTVLMFVAGPREVERLLQLDSSLREQVLDSALARFGS